MRAMASDRHSETHAPRKRGPLLLVAAGVVMGVGLGAFLLLRETTPPPAPFTVLTEPAPVEPAVREASAPPQQVQEAPLAAAPSAPAAEPPEPLPALNDSDELVRDSLIEALGDGQATAWLPTDDILRRQAVLLNSLREGTVLRKPISLPTPLGAFLARQQGERLLLATDNYQRYEPLVVLFETVDAASVAAWYGKFEPLLAAAWTELGNDRQSLTRAIAESLELAIATPDIDGDLDLVRPAVMYKYADPALEALPDVQKLLLRMGPDNRARVKAQCRRLLEALPG